MPDTRSHRGPHPEDQRLFALEVHERLRAAVGDCSWLLSRGYAEPSAIKIVGDRYKLHQRQRMAVRRSSCSDVAREDRLRRRVAADALRGAELLIDGYNLLTTLETALAGGVLLIGRDSAMRDIAGVHGTWRRVEETLPAIMLAGEHLQALPPASVRWLLDRPVSNSGQLKEALLSASIGHSWNWDVQVVENPDKDLIAGSQIVASADGVILDGCQRWFNLAGEVVAAKVEGRWVVDLAH